MPARQKIKKSGAFPALLVPPFILPNRIKWATQARHDMISTDRAGGSGEGSVRRIDKEIL
jgi:hypothetical protein